MKRLIPWCILLALVASAPVHAATSVSVGVSIGPAPPPPAIVFQSRPALVAMPYTDVWYYDGPGDYDYFRCGSFFYVYNEGYWYRSSAYRGPFVVIRQEYVPRVFYGLHDRGYHWRQRWAGMPPGQAKKWDRREDDRVRVSEDRGRDHDRGNGHGHGKGHGHGHGHDDD